MLSTVEPPIIDARNLVPYAVPRTDMPRADLRRRESVDVSVCIANWNCREFLRACLHSLLRTTSKSKIEVIVADNASSDGAAEMVEREFPEVVLIRNRDNLGFAFASNQAANAASGRHLFFLNNDTVVPTGAIDRLIAFADAHPNCGMVGPRLRDGEGNLQISYRKKPSLKALLHRAAILRWTGIFRKRYDDYRRDNFDPEGIRRVEMLMGAAVIVPRAVYEKCGGWDEAFRFGVEDVEYSDRVGRDYALVHVPGVEIIHHGRVSSRKNVSFSAPNLMIGYVLYFRKSGASVPALIAYKTVYTLDAPVLACGKLMQYAWRKLTGSPAEKTERSRLAFLGSWHFLTRELVRFWRA
jgi:N-acetylglucosaminyl-diphospho-decaprenol L-rhamnosyltransferase